MRTASGSTDALAVAGPRATFCTGCAPVTGAGALVPADGLLPIADAVGRVTHSATASAETVRRCVPGRPGFSCPPVPAVSATCPRS